jgi:small-conductance mechanosensitive channel
MNKQYRVLAALTFLIGATYGIGQGITAPISLVSGVNEAVIERIIIGAYFLSLTFLIAKIVKIEFFHGYLERALNVKVPGLIGDLGSGVIVFAGTCIILSAVFKQNISALIVTGAGSAAILGFALKDFAVALATGITLNFEDTLKVGNRVRIIFNAPLQNPEGGFEGVVQRITWRNTVLLTDSMQSIYLSNVSVSNATIFNYDIPDKRYKNTIVLEIDYDISVESAERILYAGTLGASSVKFAEPPVIRAKEMKPTGISYVISYVITDYKDAGTSEHAIIKSVLESMRVADITIACGENSRDSVKIANRTHDVYHLAQQVQLFGNFSESALRTISEHISPVRLVRGASIVYAGERNDVLYVVGEGIISCNEVDSKDNLVKKRFIATEFFGTQALFAHMPHPATVIAETDVLLYQLTKSALTVILKKHPELVSEFATNLARLNKPAGILTTDDRSSSLHYMKDLYLGIVEANYPTT